MGGGVVMGKVDAKPRGRMTAYAYFVQTCREEHKKKHPDETVIFAEFSRKCAERWKVINVYYIVYSVLLNTLKSYDSHWCVRVDDGGQREEAFPRDGREGQTAIRTRDAELCAAQRHDNGPWKETETAQGPECAKTFIVSS